MHSFSTLCFQGLEKGYIGNRWVKLETVYFRLLGGKTQYHQIFKIASNGTKDSRMDLEKFLEDSF